MNMNIIHDFYRMILPTDTFSVGAEKLAKLFIRTEEHLDPSALLSLILDNAPTQKTLEFIILSFLDIRESDYDIIEYGSKFKRLRRIFASIEKQSSFTGESAFHIFNEISNIANIHTVNELSIASRVATGWMKRLRSGNPLTERECIQLSMLIKAEAQAIKLQSDTISTSADAYNMKAMAHLLPLISAADELSQSIIETSDKLLQNRPIGEPVLTFEYTMKSPSFNKVLKKISQSPANNAFLQLLSLQRSKLIPSLRLAAVSSISRFIYNNKGSPLDWITHALERSSRKGFKIDAGDSLLKLKPYIFDQGIIVYGTTVYGNFNTISLNNFVGPDRLSKTFGTKTEYSIQELISLGMRNDALMCRLLDNPKIYNIPRMVETIAKSSRSQVVLLKIASVPELHTGPINNGVPLALLKNPTHLPVGVLRSFINPRYISLMDMRSIVKAPFGVRQDIFYEIKRCVESVR